MNISEALRLVACLADDTTHQPALVREGGSCPILPEKVLIRTVTNYHVGRVLSVDDSFIVLGDASWVASTGRWNLALTSGVLDEVEPFPGPVWVSRAAIVDLTEWTHDLPRTTK